MVLPQAKHIIGFLWLAFFAIWTIGAFFTKRAVRTQSIATRILHTAISALAFVVGFTRAFDFGVFARPFIPKLPAVIDAGVLLTAVGIAFAVWARLSLGGNWSGAVTVKENHTLTVRGPYRIVRHPIYAGLLLALGGTDIVFRDVRGLLAIGLVGMMLLMKARIEEKFMLEQFGLEYREYMRHVKAFIPCIW
jgi:protein-S-isoprenylcysteine O-methyltransferase Ste14